MNRLLRWSGGAFALLLAAYFVHFAIGTLKQYDLGALLAPRLLAATAVAAVLYALIIPVSGWAWSVLLRDIGQAWPAPRLAAIMGVTQLAKYVPGNVGQHIGRAALSLSKGIPPGSYAVSVLVETLLAMCAGLAVGLACVLLSPQPASLVLTEYRLLFGVLVVAMSLALLALLALPKLAALLPWLLRRIASTARWVDGDFATPRSSAIVRAFLAYAVNYFLIGFGLWLVARAIGGEVVADYFYLTAAFALSWLIGFLMPGAPAGLGVREGAMALLLASVGTGDAVLVMIAAMRLATLAGDALCFAVSVLYFRFAKSGGMDGTTA